jgi:hypothetical protein
MLWSHADASFHLPLRGGGKERRLHPLGVEHVEGRALLDVLDAKPPTPPVLTLKPSHVSCDIDRRTRAEALPSSTDPKRQMR